MAKIGEEFESIVAVGVMILVVIRVEVVDVEESTVFVGVTEDLIRRVEVTFDVTDSIIIALVWLSVPFQVVVA